jgi:hypothetical protein
LTINDLSGEQLGGWQEKHRDAIITFRKMVYAFYSRDFSFGKFIRKYPEFRQNVVDILAGDVYQHDFTPMFEAIGNVVPSHQEAAKQESTVAVET